jgi:fimbrial isopeptide formation D2 family protein
VSDYRVVDTLPAELAYAASPAPTVTIRSAAGAPVQLTSPTDFTVTPAGDVYTMELTPQGYDELWLAGDNAQVDFTIATTVTSIPSDGTITNTAKVFIDSAEFDVQAQSLWGTARVNKHAQGDEDARLAGAEFQVFATEAAANAAAAQVASGDPVTGGLEFGAGSTAGADRKTFTTADQGADHGFVVINRLKASAAGTKYWVVETKAPAGYVAAAAPTEITVYPGTGLTGSGSVANVPNQMREAGALPVLGGAGMTAIGVAGAILIAGGVLFAIFGRRKQTEDPAEV